MSVTSEKELVLTNKYGLHARPATLLAEVANKFRAVVTVIKDGEEVDGKSIFGLMMLAAECGSILRIRAVGEDAEQAVSAIEQVIAAKFNEE